MKRRLLAKKANTGPRKMPTTASQFVLIGGPSRSHIYVRWSDRTKAGFRPLPEPDTNWGNRATHLLLSYPACFEWAGTRVRA